MNLVLRCKLETLKGELDFKIIFSEILSRNKTTNIRKTLLIGTFTFVEAIAVDLALNCEPLCERAALIFCNTISVTNKNIYILQTVRRGSLLAAAFVYFQVATGRTKFSAIISLDGHKKA